MILSSLKYSIYTKADAGITVPVFVFVEILDISLYMW